MDLQDILESMKQMEIRKGKDRTEEMTYDLYNCREDLYYLETPESKEAGYRWFARWLRETAKVFVRYEIASWYSDSGKRAKLTELVLLVCSATNDAAAFLPCSVSKSVSRLWAIWSVMENRTGWYVETAAQFNVFNER